MKLYTYNQLGFLTGTTVSKPGMARGLYTKVAPMDATDTHKPRFNGSVWELAIDESLQTEAVARIKSQVAALMVEVEGVDGWRLQRAKERSVSNQAHDSLILLYAQKSAIRSAGNALEASVPDMTIAELERVTFTFDYTTVNMPVVKIITTSALQRRLTLNEEVAIRTQGDETLTVIRERLFNATYVDLELQEVKDGVAGIVAFLATIDDPENPGTMLVTDVEERTSTLLAFGTSNERYIPA